MLKNVENNCQLRSICILKHIYNPKKIEPLRNMLNELSKLVLITLR